MNRKNKILVMANFALQDSQNFDNIREAMGMTDEEMISFRSQLEDEVGMDHEMSIVASTIIELME